MPLSTRSAGYKILATDWNAIIDRINLLYERVGCRLVRSADQTLTTAVQTAINFTAEGWDSHAFHDNTTNNTRITIPSGLAGQYSINAQVRFASSAVGNRYVRILLNGTTTIALKQDAAATAGNGFVFEFKYYLNVGDYIELVGYQDSGGDLNILFVTENTPIFAVTWSSI